MKNNLSFSAGNKKAIVLLSGGLDSATCLAIAKHQGYNCCAITFQYGQRSQAEIKAAKKIAATLGVTQHALAQLQIPSFLGSALTDTDIEVPEYLPENNEIPVTYVPARNTVFLAMALGLAEVINARTIFIGANAVDYSNYPDCRPAFIEAFEKLAHLATKAGVEGEHFKIEAPLIALSKAEIIQWGHALGIDYSLTVSCYQADEEGRACGRCSSCQQRAKGFEQAGLSDPTRYQTAAK